MTEAVVPNGAQPARQHMPQIPLGKFHAGNGPGIDPIARGAILPAEGDRVLGDRQDPGIAEGGAGYRGPSPRRKSIESLTPAQLGLQASRGRLRRPTLAVAPLYKLSGVWGIFRSHIRTIPFQGPADARS